MFCNIPEFYQPGVSTLPVKTFGYFQMATKAVPRAEFYFKGDDDVFFDVFSILRLIKEWEQTTSQSIGKRHYGGLLYKDAPVIRDPNSPWFISKEAYGGEVIPNYHSGALYYLTNSLARCLAEASANPLLPYNAVDDAAVGIMLKQFCNPFEIHNLMGNFDCSLYALKTDPEKYHKRLEVIIQQSKDPIVAEVKGEGNILRIYEARHNGTAVQYDIPRYSTPLLEQKFLDFCKHPE